MLHNAFQCDRSTTKERASLTFHEISDGWIAARCLTDWNFIPKIRSFPSVPDIYYIYIYPHVGFAISDFMVHIRYRSLEAWMGENTQFELEMKAFWRMNASTDR